MSVPGPACTSPPLPVMTLLKFVPCVNVSLWLKASVPPAPIVIRLAAEIEPKLPPLPTCSVPAVIVVGPM